MISDEQVDAIAEGWVKEFSVEPYVLREREMDAWFKLDDLIYNDPEDALRVFEKVAERDLVNWTFEGFAIGPLQTFLSLYGDRYSDELRAIRRRSKAFDEIHAMAVEGL